MRIVYFKLSSYNVPTLECKLSSRGTCYPQSKFQCASSVTLACLLWNTGSGLTRYMYFSMGSVVLDNVFQGANSLVAATVK